MSWSSFEAFAHPWLRAGEYRNLQQRLTNNAEPVAFYGGIDREGSLIRARFRQLVKHQAHLLRTQWRFSMWQVGWLWLSA